MTTIFGMSALSTYDINPAIKFKKFKRVEILDPPVGVRFCLRFETMEDERNSVGMFEESGVITTVPLNCNWVYIEANKQLNMDLRALITLEDDTTTNVRLKECVLLWPYVFEFYGAL